MIPEHCRAAGLAKAERAINDLTDAAGQLGLADKRVTCQLVALWNAFHPGGAPCPVRRETPRLPRPPRPAPDPTRKRPRRTNTPEGIALLQDVLRGLMTQRAAAAMLGVTSGALTVPMRRLREERQRQRAEQQRQQADATVLSFIDAF